MIYVVEVVCSFWIRVEMLIRLIVMLVSNVKCRMRFCVGYGIFLMFLFLLFLSIVDFFGCFCCVGIDFVVWFIVEVRIKYVEMV